MSPQSSLARIQKHIVNSCKYSKLWNTTKLASFLSWISRYHPSKWPFSHSHFWIVFFPNTTPGHIASGSFTFPTTNPYGIPPGPPATEGPSLWACRLSVMPRALRAPALQPPPRDPRHPPVPAAPTSGVRRTAGGWDIKWSSERKKKRSRSFLKMEKLKMMKVFSIRAATLLVSGLDATGSMLKFQGFSELMVIIFLVLRSHDNQPLGAPKKKRMIRINPQEKYIQQQQLPGFG